MNQNERSEFRLSCPAPLGLHHTVQLAHGGGGRHMQDLIRKYFLAAFDGAERPESAPHDSAVLAVERGRVAFTTDSFVVNPLFFPGGDIGKLAVCGTVNDLAMAGARPAWLSAGFILEEGFPLETLGRIVRSMADTARACGVRIVTGDTKVVDQGKGDGIYINTAGLGVVPEGVDLRPERVRPGDALLVSGDLGRHGMAVMSVREGLEFESSLQSDCAPLAGAVAALLESGVDLHCLRDLTRGGLAAALHEIAADAGVGVEVQETAVPVSEAVAAICELLGLDPLYTANEGRFVAFLPAEQAGLALAVLGGRADAPAPALIGTVTASHPGEVYLIGALGGPRLLDLLSGEQMPRIC